MALLAKEKPVFVAVYVEKLRRKKSLLRIPSSSRNQVQHRRQHHHHHHHLHHHLYVHQGNKDKQHGQQRGRGYNRRAELLEYSRNLRDSARSTASTPLLLQHTTSPDSHSTDQQTAAQKQIFPVKKKAKTVKIQTCLGDWKVLIPRLFSSSKRPSAKKKTTNKYNSNKRNKRSIDFQTTGTRIKTIIKSFQVNKNRGFMSKVFASLKKHR